MGTESNALGHDRPLPHWFWNGETAMVYRKLDRVAPGARAALREQAALTLARIGSP